MGYCSRACGRVEARFLDLAELSSVVAFAASHAQEPDGIDGLLSNAGGLPVNACAPTADGFEVRRRSSDPNPKPEPKPRPKPEPKP